MPPKRKENPFEAVVEVLVPAVIVLFVIAAIAWLVPQVNAAIPLGIGGFGSGLIIGAVVVLAAIYYKYQ